MHLTAANSIAASGSERGLTLVEMMVTMGVFSMVVAALVYAHMFGLKQDQLVESKLGASDQSRKSFALVQKDIRSAKIWKLGTGNASSFTAAGDGTLQQGNTLQINLTTDTNQFVRYYFDTTDSNNNMLRRMHSPNGSATQVIASNLFNTLTFNAEDQSGTTQTTNTWRYVIHFNLQFRQYQYPKTIVGPNALYDYYKMEFRLTPYAPE